MDELSEAFRCFLFPLLGLAALVTLWDGRVQAQKRKSMLERQATKRGGEFIQGGWFDWPKVRFACQGEDVDIFMTPRNRYHPAQTRAQFEPQNILLSECRLVDNRLPEGRITLPRMERMMTQDEAFDARYTLWVGPDRLMAFRLAQTPIREQLLACDLPLLEIEVRPAVFEMSMRRIPLDEADLDNFIETALLVIRLLIFESVRKPQPALDG